LKHLFFILFLFSIQSTPLIAQGEYNNWCFGAGNRVDFNSGSPVASTSSINSINSSSTISDKNGNLLFYVQEDTVWSANGNMMTNGFNLLAYGKQSTNILPFPCNDSLYYIFTYSYNSNNLYYSVVNINSYGGLGMVIQKNIFLDSNIVTGFAMTRHGNNLDYWITYQHLNTNIFSSRIISSLGVGLPIQSQLGPIKSNVNFNGSLKFSPNGEYLVNCSISNQLIEYYEFDNNTGILSSNHSLILPTGYPQSNTALFSQFSPDLSKLYITGFWYILQYDFSSGVPSIINNSANYIIPPNVTPNSFIDIALAPDNKIYISRSINSYLGVINQPNNLGPACNFVNNGLNTLGQSRLGFPTMLANLFVQREVFTDSLFCQYDTINLYLSDTNYIDSLVWDFGDPNSGSANTSIDVVPLHVFNTYGVYPIKVIVYSGCVNDTIHDTIRINPTAIAHLGNDTIMCEGDSMQLLFNDTSFNYLWNTGDTTMSIQILNSDTFSIAISSICGVDYDTIIIDSIIPALVNFPNDTLICEGDSIFLDATVQNGTYLWSTGDTVSSLWANNPGGTFWATTTNICRSDSDTIVVNYTHSPNINLGNDSLLCNGSSFVLDGWDTLSNFIWSTGDTLSTIIADTTGFYFVLTSNLCGADSDSIQLWFIDSPTVSLGVDTILCPNSTVILQDTSSVLASYIWNNGSWQDSTLVTNAGLYSLTVTNICGVASDTIVVDFDTIPMVNLGSDTVICNGDSVLLSAAFSHSMYLWNTGSIDSVLTATTQGTYWASATNICGSDTDSVYINVDSVLVVDLGLDTILCLGTSYTLVSTTIVTGGIPDSFLWSTGNTTDSIYINSAGIYQLTVTNVCGSFDDTIEVFYDNSPITNLGPDSTYCLNSLVNLNAYWSRANYLWNTADTTSGITANFSGNYSVMVTNLCGFDGDTVMIKYDIPIAFNLGSDTALCAGDSILLSAPAHNATWLWNNATIDSTLLVNNAGNFYVTALNQCGMFSDSIKVILETTPVINPAIYDTTLCEEEILNIVVAKNNATSISWLNGSNNYAQSFDTTGWYSYSLQNICGTTSDTFRLEIQYPADAFLGDDTVICYGEQIVKSFDYSNHAYLWNNGLTDSIQIITTTGIYGITIFTPANCESYDEFEVTECGAQLFIPNAFTPGNGDQHNNTFKVQGVGIRKYHIAIYDRWGMLVFESFDLDNSWSGSSAGSATAPLAPSGVYTYKIWYNTGESSESIIRVGSVTLLR
jgi:gliding motility-associated-like protein